MRIAVAFLLVALQQGVAQSAGEASPANGDTVGYWQQRVEYAITATLDEPGARVRARGTLKYVNNAPDTLRVMYFHQYLNAFRPGSKWSADDEREGRERFQRLREPDYGYERFTAPVRVNGTAVTVEYPGAPDSTVALIRLPSRLAPRDSLVVTFEWDARPSTVPRRQGRRGRHWDLAQWYPKVAVYDRGGWQPNALRPAGEFYGEFGTYDVTLVVPEDQVVGATGVPVSGDPGWARATRAGVAPANANAYDGVIATRDAAPAGFKVVRFLARDVHHFAWSTSPDYRYEGGAYVRPTTRARFPTWDTVPIHVLYRPGDDTTWGGLRAVRRTQIALRWLESIYGPYAYPQMTVLHRIDGGGTEFPMMQMNGSPSQGLILHEGGHNWTYGILANNEWRSGWMDEGLTSYQTDWAQGFTPQERVRAGIVDQFAPLTGYRARGIRMALPRFQRIALEQATTDLEDSAQPVGTVAHEFRDFPTYNEMIYTRAQVMYGQLRDALGDSLFVEFLHDYYARWALRHVDERAMRASAERVSGRDLGWFFGQWVHRTGVMDYALDRVRTRDSAGTWITAATVRRHGEYRHPMTLGLRTPQGWMLTRVGDETQDVSTAFVTTAEKPLEVRLDPSHFTWDWDRRNDVARRVSRTAFDWPFLVQADRERSLRLWRPMAWYSAPGGVTAGLRVRGSYLGWLDKWEFGEVAALRGRAPGDDFTLAQRFQGWARIENPYWRFMRRPAVGWSASVAALDDAFKTDIAFDQTKARRARSASSRLAVTYTSSTGTRLLPELWSEGKWLDVSWRDRIDWQRNANAYFVELSGIGGGNRNGAFIKPEAAVGVVHGLSAQATVSGRLYAGSVEGSDDRPAQRSLFLSAADPVSTFDNHWWRPRGSILKQSGVNWLPLGGAAMRGYHWSEQTSRIVAGNVELARQVGELRGGFGSLDVWLAAFGDVASSRRSSDANDAWLSDAGAGFKFRGAIYDAPINLRIDFPVFVSNPALAIDQGRAGRGPLAPRWVISFNDIW